MPMTVVRIHRINITNNKIIEILNKVAFPALIILVANYIKKTFLVLISILDSNYDIIIMVKN